MPQQYKNRFAAKVATVMALAALSTWLTPATAQVNLQLSSTSLVNGVIRKVHACPDMGGKDQPLQLTISNIPSDAAYLSIVADDPDALAPAGKVWVHWNVFNVPTHGKSAISIAAGEKLQGELGKTSDGMRGYEGMCPPKGTHTYRFAVFASAVKLKPSSPATVEGFETQHSASIVSKQVLLGTFP